MIRTLLTAAMAALALLLDPVPALAQDKSAPIDPAVKRYKEAKEKKAKAPRTRPVDINSASKAELKKLSGIGDAEADRIIAGRPYTSKADLATRKIIPTGVFVQIRRNIIALPKPTPKTPGK